MPRHHMTSSFTFFLRGHIPLLYQSLYPCPPFTSPLTKVTPQSAPATLPGRIHHSLLPAISCSKQSVGNLLLANLSVSPLTYPPRPTYIRSLKTTVSLLSSIAYCVISLENTFLVALEHFSPFSLCFSQTSQATIIPTNDCLIYMYFYSDGAKIKEDRS